MNEVDQLKLIERIIRELERVSFEIKTNQPPELGIMSYNAIVSRIQRKIAATNAQGSFNLSIEPIHEQHIRTIVKNEIFFSNLHLGDRCGHIKRKALANSELNFLQHR